MHNNGPFFFVVAFSSALQRHVFVHEYTNIVCIDEKFQYNECFNSINKSNKIHVK